MISLIICSTKTEINPALLDNISNTIGTDYEVVFIDNSKNQYNIFQAYNEGVKRAKGDILCFMHEDILYHTNKWGTVVEDYMQQSNIGALGVAGGHYVAKELDWRFYGFGHVNLIQGTNTIEEHPKYHRIYIPPKSKFTPLINVSVLDGVWFCIRKELFEQVRFDDINFHDFHLYDSDICMQINSIGKDIFVCADIFIEHFSEGTFTEGYQKSLDIFFKKWDAYLPLLRGCRINKEELEQAMQKAHKEFSDRIKRDATLVQLRKKINMNKSGLSYEPYTPEEAKIIEKSAFGHCRLMIKDCSVPTSMAWKLVREYGQSSVATRGKKLYLKFFWYRILRLGKKSTTQRYI